MREINTLLDLVKQKNEHIDSRFLKPAQSKNVTSLDAKDFKRLNSLNVFNGLLINDAIFLFKRYEDSSLCYIGIDKDSGEENGGWDTEVMRSVYDALFYNQQVTMEAAVDYVLGVSHEAVFAVSDKDAEEEEERVIAKTANPVTCLTHARKTPVALPMPDFVTVSFGIKSPIAPEPVKKEVKSTVDTSCFADGVTVQHKAFGAGTVIELGGGLITVAFIQGQKRFEVPGASENGFLKV